MQLLQEDIVVAMPDHGMRLRFAPTSQRLQLIEVYDLSRMQVTPCDTVPCVSVIRRCKMQNMVVHEHCKSTSLRLGIVKRS